MRPYVSYNKDMRGSNKVAPDRSLKRNKLISFYSSESKEKLSSRNVNQYDGLLEEAEEISPKGRLGLS